MDISSYWQKNDDPKYNLFADLIWNIPDQKTGSINIIGGNQQAFSAPIKTAMYLAETFPIQKITTILPDKLQKKLPNLENIEFAPSTQSGSFADTQVLQQLANTSDINLILGDLSKNTITSNAISALLKNTEQPTLLTRDAIDAILPNTQEIMSRPKTFYLLSLIQLQKLLRSIYYPKMIVLSMPLLQLVEILHKFTLSYPATIITFHEGKILIANEGKVISTPIPNTKYTPLSLWSGQLAGNIAAFNLYNPNQPLKASVAALSK